MPSGAIHRRFATSPSSPGASRGWASSSPSRCARSSPAPARTRSRRSAPAGRSLDGGARPRTAQPEQAVRDSVRARLDGQTGDRFGALCVTGRPAETRSCSESCSVSSSVPAPSHAAADRGAGPRARRAGRSARARRGREGRRAPTLARAVARARPGVRAPHRGDARRPRPRRRRPASPTGSRRPTSSIRADRCASRTRSFATRSTTGCRRPSATAGPPGAAADPRRDRRAGRRRGRASARHGARGPRRGRRRPPRGRRDRALTRSARRRPALPGASTGRAGSAGRATPGPDGAGPLGGAARGSAGAGDGCARPSPRARASPPPGSRPRRGSAPPSPSRVARTRRTPWPGACWPFPSAEPAGPHSGSDAPCWGSARSRRRCGVRSRALVRSNLDAALAGADLPAGFLANAAIECALTARRLRARGGARQARDRARGGRRRGDRRAGAGLRARSARGDGAVRDRPERLATEVLLDSALARHAPLLRGCALAAGLVALPAGAPERSPAADAELYPELMEAPVTDAMIAGPHVQSLIATGHVDRAAAIADAIAGGCTPRSEPDRAPSASTRAWRSCDWRRAIPTARST